MIKKFKLWIIKIVNEQIKNSLELNNKLKEVNEETSKPKEYEDVFKLYIHFKNGKVEEYTNIETVEYFEEFAHWFCALKRETFQFKYKSGYKIYIRSEISFVNVCVEEVLKIKN